MNCLLQLKAGFNILIVTMLIASAFQAGHHPRDTRINMYSSNTTQDIVRISYEMPQHNLLTRIYA